MIFPKVFSSRHFSEVKNHPPPSPWSSNFGNTGWDKVKQQYMYCRTSWKLQSALMHCDSDRKAEHTAVPKLT